MAQPGTDSGVPNCIIAAWADAIALIKGQCNKELRAIQSLHQSETAKLTEDLDERCEIITALESEIQKLKDVYTEATSGLQQQLAALTSELAARGTELAAQIWRNEELEKQVKKSADLTAAERKRADEAYAEAVTLRVQISIADKEVARLNEVVRSYDHHDRTSSHLL